MVATYSDKEPQQQNYLKKLVKPLATLGLAAIAFLTNGCYSAPKYSNEKQPMAMHAPADSLDSLIQEEKPQDSPAPKADPQDPPKPQESNLGTTPEEIELENQAIALYKPATKKYNSLQEVDDATAEELASDIAKSYWLFKKAEDANPDNEVYSDFIKSSREWVGLVKYKKQTLAEQEPELDAYIASFKPQDPVTLPVTKAPDATPAPYVPQLPPKVNRHPLRFGLHDGATAWAEYLRASRESSEIDRVQAGVSADYGILGIDLLGHGHKNKWRDAASNDRIIDDGTGAYAKGRLWALEASVAMGENTRKRTSHEQNVTTDPNFIITDTTRAVETTESNYKAASAALKLGSFKPGLTLWDATDDLNVDVETIVDVINLNDPAGNYTNTINTNISKEITRRGLQPSLFYLVDDSVLGRARFGGIGSYDRIEIEGPEGKIEEYSVTALADLADVNDAFALSVGAGKRWVDNSESNRKFDPAHGFVNGAADLEQLVGVPDTTVFGSVWRRDEPGAGLGLVFGKNGVPMVMNYRNAVAHKELEFLNHMAPEERNVYLRMLQHNLVQDLGSDELNLLLFGGANRSTVKGKQQWDPIGEAVLTLPIVERFTTALYGRVENDGMSELREAGVYLGPVKIGAGMLYTDGVKHEKAPILRLSFGFDF